jgi:alanyl-tRNA synthetase
VFEKRMQTWGIVDNSIIYDTARKDEVKMKKIIGGEDIFLLYATYGFPAELIYEEAFKRNITVPDQSKTQFAELLEEDRERSRTSAKGAFKGGLAGDKDIHKKYHTATHLLQSALRELFGPELRQHGSNITEERLRFDFAHGEKMTDEQKAQVEALINKKIEAALSVSFTEMPKEEAEKTGAAHALGDKYGDIVKVYTIGSEETGVFSREFCGGPHVSNTSELGVFKIQKEEAVSAGVRRIKAVLN